MSPAVKKDPDHTQGSVDVQEADRSGEHPIGLDAMIRSSFESAFESDLQTTSRVSRFELEEVLSSPEARPSIPPEGAGGPEAPEATVKTTVADVRAAMAAMAEAPAPESEPIVPTPIVNVVPEGIAIDSLPAPAIEVNHTKEEERDP